MIPKNIKVLYIFDFFISFRFYAAIQIIYFARVTGSYTLATSLFAVATLSQAVLEIPTGVYSDIIGRKNTIVICAISAVFSVTFYAIGHNYWYLFIGSLFEGLSKALGSGNNDAMLYDSLKEVDKQDEFQKYYGKTNTMSSIAFGIAALIGGFLATISFGLALWLSVGSQVIALCASAFLHSPPLFKKAENNPYRHFWESTKAFSSNPKLRLLTLTNAASYSLTESSFQFSAVFVNTLWPLWAVSAKNTFTNFGGAFSFYISDKIITRFKALQALTLQFGINRVLNIIAYGFPNVFSPVIMSLTSLNYGIGQVARNTLLQKEFTDHQRATMGSLDSIVSSIAFSIAYVLIGFFADKFGARNILLVVQVLLIPVLFMYWRLFIHDRNITVDKASIKHN